MTNRVTGSWNWGVCVAGIAGLCSCAFVASDARGEYAATDEFAPRVETLVVTGMREQRLAVLPRSATVITVDDIALLPATNIVELLSREANLTLRSTAGNDKFSGIDIRGQGDTYTSNVIVMVDGIRLNAEDISGADYSVVPLDQIARVEVIRGANTVRYGNGAVGGVINIITNEPGEGLDLHARARAGSYATIDTGLDASWGNEQFFGSAGVSYYDADGYRDNSELEKRDARAGIGVRSGNWFSAALNADFHRDEYGLPGPVSEAAFLGSDADRRQTNFPLDGGETDDERLRVTIELGTDETGVLRAVGMNRKRENPFVIDERSGEIREDSDRIDLKYQRDIDLLNRDHTVFLGVVSDQADYARRLGETDAVGTITKRGDVRHEAWFAAADITLAGPLQLSLGYRGDSFRLRLNDSEISDDICDDQVVFPGPAGDVTFCNDPGGARMGEVFSPAQDSWRNDAFEAGLVYSTAAETHWFLSYASSFRNPNIDELALSDAALGPQAGKHWDAGIRRLLGDTFELSLALFVVETKAEILFAIDKELSTDVFIGRNFNAGELTERRGGEVDVRWYATGSLTLTANAGYTRAEFKGSGATLPLVPRWTGGLSAQYVFAYDFTLTVTGNYVGTRYDGNDFSNAGSKLDAYKVVDAKLVWARDALSLSAGVANLFNEVYATSVYSSSYYPLPARNFYAGISYRFSALG